LKKKILFWLHTKSWIKKNYYFVSNYFDVEPKCAQDFNFGYRIEVETFPVDITTTGVTRKDNSPNELLHLIDGKKVIFTIDVSGSMADDPIDNCNEYEPRNRKGCCLKKWLIGFFDELSDDTEVSVIPYGWPPDCTREKLFSMTKLDGNRETLKKKIRDYLIKSNVGTPMCTALEQSFIYGDEIDADIIVLLTDGKENCCCKTWRFGCSGAPGEYDSAHYAEEYKDTGIAVYTVGFGSTNVDDDMLEKIADITYGKYFKAETCEELIPEPKEKINVNIKSMHWSFGDLSFSEKDALKEINTVSVPVVVYINQSTFLPGSMKITLVNGELEQFVGFVESSCRIKTESNLEMYLHYPIEFTEKEDGKYICMKILNENKCQKLNCDKEIEFSGIQRPGNYKFYSKIENGKLKIVI